jgi:putative salt-induced outer membrane protein
LATTGNTDSKNANASMKTTWDLDGPVEARLERARDRARTNGIRRRNLFSGLQGDARLLETSYLFFSADWRKDGFAGYDRQASEAVGYGRRLIDNERHMLALEGGAGAKQTEVVTGEKLDEAIVRGALDYLFTLSENSELSQKLLIERGNDNRYTESTTALKARVVGNIAVVLSLVIKNNSEVPVGIVETDRFTSVALEYAF